MSANYTAEQTIEMIRRALSRPGSEVFLDGRNEHGTHVLPMNLTTIMDDSLRKEVSEEATAETILADAEKLGFSIGDCVWVRWSYFSGQYGDEGRCEIAPCWEYDGIDVEFTKFLASCRPKAPPE